MRWYVHRLCQPIACLTHCSKITPFDRCYNASERYESKSKMSTLPIEDIKQNDLVLVEVNVGRYSTSRDGGPGGNAQQRGGTSKAKRVALAEWKPTFDLLSVSLLCSAPDDPNDVAFEDVPDADVSL